VCVCVCVYVCVCHQLRIISNLQTKCRSAHLSHILSVGFPCSSANRGGGRCGRLKRKRSADGGGGAGGGGGRRRKPVKFAGAWLSGRGPGARICCICFVDCTGVLISPYPDQEGNKLQRPNSNFCKPLKRKKERKKENKKFRSLSVQPGLCSSNDLRVGRKMATFQLFFQSGRATDLSVPLYKLTAADQTRVALQVRFCLSGLFSVKTFIRSALGEGPETTFGGLVCMDTKCCVHFVYFVVRSHVVQFVFGICTKAPGADKREHGGFPPFLHATLTLS
jgi:hypothetical protein